MNYTFQSMTNRKSLKKRAVKLKGGSCAICGYSRCLRSLHFHHINPFEKTISISNCKNWDQIKNEIDKCVLMCANCHGEIESGLIRPDDLVELIELL